MLNSRNRNLIFKYIIYKQNCKKAILFINNETHARNNNNNNNILYKSQPIQVVVGRILLVTFVYH